MSDAADAPQGLRTKSVQWTCDKCQTKNFGLEISDEYRTFTQLPSGWWLYPVDHGDTDGEDGRAIMMHAYCSKRCIEAAYASAAVAGVIAQGNAPLRATLGDLARNRPRRRIVT